jgi:cell division septation protein DedD
MPFPFESGALAEIAAGPAAALTAVALVAGPRACASGWGARAAVAIAQGWPGDRRLVLADLDVLNPTLHEQVGLELSDGVVDVVDYGVSLGTVLRRVPRAAGTERAFELLPGGYYVGEPADLLGSEAWRRVLAEIAVLRATLLAYVPADLPGMEHIVARAGAVLVIADGDEGATIAQRLPHPYAVLAVFTPPDSPVDAAATEPVVTAAAAEPVTESTRLSDEEFERIRLPKDRGTREALIKEMRDRQRAARMAPGFDAHVAQNGVAPVAAAGAGAGASFAPAPMPHAGGEAALIMRTESAADDVSMEMLDPGLLMVPPRRKYRRPLLWTMMVVLGVSMVAGAMKFLSWRADRVREFTPAPLPPAARPVQPVVGLPRDTLPFTVALEAHRDMATAFERVSALQVAEPGMRFHVAPLDREDRMFYHVMAGPVRDSATALALRDTLIAHGHKTTPTPTDVRATPLAFAVGAFPTVATAEQHLAELRTLGIPAYLIERTEQPRFQVYVGGFAAAAEAHVVRQLLRAAGIKDSLVMRTGSITP